jgi:hypothetical protein
MKLLISILLFIIFSIVISAQTDSSSNKKEKNNFENELNKDTKTHISNKHFIPPRNLIIKSKDLIKVDSLIRNKFIVIDSHSEYTADELASGLSESELDAYQKNKEETKNLLILPPGEEVTYPLIAKLRKVLGTAQTISTILILLLSL